MKRLLDREAVEVVGSGPETGRVIIEVPEAVVAASAEDASNALRTAEGAALMVMVKVPAAERLTYSFWRVAATNSADSTLLLEPLYRETSGAESVAHPPSLSRLDILIVRRLRSFTAPLSQNLIMDRLTRKADRDTSLDATDGVFIPAIRTRWNRFSIASTLRVAMGVVPVTPFGPLTLKTSVNTLLLAFGATGQSPSREAPLDRINVALVAQIHREYYGGHRI